MEFNRRKGISAVAAIMIMVLFSVAVFLAPITRGVTFWLGYSFAILAAILTACTFMFVSDAQNRSKTFLRLSIGAVAWIYLVVQMVVSIEQIGNFFIPYLTALVTDCAITFVFVILLLSTRISAEEIERQDAETAKKVNYINELCLTLSTLKTDDPELKKKIDNLAEDVKFSDPMSHSDLAETEAEIAYKTNELKSSISDSEKSLVIVEEIGEMLRVRNERCKMLKNKPEPKPQKDNRGVKYVGVALGIVALLGAVALAVVFYIIPQSKYDEASKLYNDGQYEQSVIAFEELKGYKDSDQMVEKAQIAIKDAAYDKAMKLYLDGNYADAIAAFGEMEDYRDSKSMIVNAREALYDEEYVKAKGLLDSGDYLGAIAVFEELDNYRDSKEKIEEVKEKMRADLYDAAVTYFENQNYVEALNLFTELKDYKDSAQKTEDIKNKLERNDGVFYFGTFRGEPIAWQIVDVTDSLYTLTTADILVDMAYNDELSNVDWNESTLREWLNGEFLDSFTDSQKESILTVKIDESDASAYLMSKEDIIRLKGNDYLSVDRAWWIRTKDDTMALYVDKDGNLVEQGDIVVRALGVRPCIQIDMRQSEG